MENFKLTIEYDGSPWRGWQRQKFEPTLQSAIEEALETMTGAPVKLIGSGRTDAGVHALAQVANFRCETSIPPEAFQRGLNSLLPDSIVILSCEPAPDEFHARRDAVGKTYQYRILNRPIPAAVGRQYHWHIRAALDMEAMRRAAQAILGEHDFSAFEGAGSPKATSVRTVKRAELVQKPPDRVIFEIEGTGFLRYMVRNIVGTLVQVGLGKIPPTQMEAILHSRKRDLAGPTAPARGLFLKEVVYRD